MTRAATSGEKITMRESGQASDLYVDFYKPATVYSARLNGAPSSFDQVAQIDYDTGVGTLANVKAGMTLWVGSSAGDSDLGICRIRKTPTSAIFYIGEQSRIAWVDNCYLTIVEDFDLWHKHIFMSGSTPLMDHDVAYSNQHSVFNPVPLLGPIVRVAKLTGPTVTIQLGSESGIDSYVYGSSISTYLWACATADSFSSTGAARPTVTFSDPGWHVVYCTVTSAAGASKIGVRFVRVWSDDDLPYSVRELSDFTEDPDQGGINFGVRIDQAIPFSDVPRRALTVLFAVDYYGSMDALEETSVGPVTGAENVLGIGRLADEGYSYDYEAGVASFEINGMQELFRKIPGFPTGVEITGTADAWTNMSALTVDRGLWHLLEWRTTATAIMDVILTGDTRYTKDAISPSTNLWTQMTEIAFNQILANVRVDHLGRLFAEIDPLLIPEADRDYPVIMELEKQDLSERVEIENKTIERTSQVSISGIAVTLGGTGAAFFALSPGHVFEHFGNVDNLDRLLLESQAQANQLAGLIYAARNNDLMMRARLMYNNRFITCIPNQAVTFEIESTDTPRGLATTRNWIPRRRRMSYDVEIGFLESSLELEPETSEALSATNIVPGSGDFSIPPLPGLPPLPTLSFPLPGPINTTPDGPKKVLVHGTVAGLMMSANFNAATPTWYTCNAGLTTAQAQNINRMIKCPNGAIYVGYVGVVAGSNAFIARAPYAGGIFEIVEDAASIAAKLGETGLVVTFACNPLKPEEVAYTLNPYAFPGSLKFKMYLGAGSAFVETMEITGVETAFGNLSYGNGYWILTCLTGSTSQWIRLNSGLTAVVDRDLTGVGLFGLIYHTRVGTTGKTYHHTANDDTIAIGLDNCADFTTGIGSATYDTDGPQDSVFACDPTGTFIMCRRTVTGHGKSSDGGYTLTDVATLPALGTWGFAYAGGSGTSSRWIAVSSYLYYSDSFGINTWVDKRGNILDLQPILILDDVLVVEF